MEDLQSILSIVDTLGTLGMLIWLVRLNREDYKLEIARHDTTRENYKRDLRVMAGIRQGDEAPTYPKAFDNAEKQKAIDDYTTMLLNEAIADKRAENEIKKAGD